MNKGKQAVREQIGRTQARCELFLGLLAGYQSLLDRDTWTAGEVKESVDRERLLLGAELNKGDKL